MTNQNQENNNQHLPKPKPINISDIMERQKQKDKELAERQAWELEERKWQTLNSRFLLSHLQTFGKITLLELKTLGAIGKDGQRHLIKSYSEQVRRLRAEGWSIKTELYWDESQGKQLAQYVYYGHKDDGEAKTLY